MDTFRREDFPHPTGCAKPFAEVSTAGEHHETHASTWTWYRMYQTDRGWLCQKIRSSWDRKEPTLDEKVVSTLQEARQYFGGGWLVRELFDSIPFIHKPRLLVNS